MKQFIVGHEYGAVDTAVPPITVIKRTDKTITVVSEMYTSPKRMKIKKWANGNEFATDTTVPYSWQECYTYSTEYDTCK